MGDLLSDALDSIERAREGTTSQPWLISTAADLSFVLISRDRVFKPGTGEFAKIGDSGDRQQDLRDLEYIAMVLHHLPMLLAEHERRVTELLEANNPEVERRRAAEAQNRYLEHKWNREIARSEVLAVEVSEWQARYNAAMDPVVRSKMMEPPAPMMVCAICAAKIPSVPS